MTTANTPRKTVARKAPTDRLPSKADRIAENEAPPAGHDLLKPITSMRSGEITEAQADIMALFEDMGIDLKSETKDQEIETSPGTLRAMGKLGALLENHAADVEAYVAFDSGPGAQTRVIELAMWFLGRLGE